MLIFKKKKKRINTNIKNCSIANGVVINNTILNEYCNFAHDCEIMDSKIGKRTSIGRYTKIRDSEIGSYCSISWDVTIGATSHPFKNITSHAFTYRKQFGIVDKDKEYKKVITEIGNDVWIGCGAIIRSGVKIGNGAIIGAGAVVTKDVEPYTIVGGVPASVIRKRFDQEIIDRINNLHWWDYDDVILKENIELFNNELTIEIIEKLEKLKNKEIHN